MGVTWVLAMVLAQAAPAAESGESRGAGGEALVPASIDVRSDLGKRFRLVEAHVVLDGREVATRTAAGGQELEHAFRAYDGQVAPGAHNVDVTLVYQGRNPRFFTYVDDYQFRVESTADLNAPPGGGPAAVQVLAYERPGATVPVERKPMMEIKAAPGSKVTLTPQAPEPVPTR
jgi:hypothetical protein